MKIVNDDESPFTGTFKFDGYSFGGRLLEGVYFHADATDGIVDFDSVRVAPDAANYFEDLNQKKWLAAAREFIKETDALETLDGKENVWVENENQSTIQPKPVNIQGLSGADFLAHLKGKK